MRLLHFGFLYPPYVNDFFSRHPGLVNRAFEEQDATLKADFFAGSDALTTALRPLGYDTRDYAFDVESIQKAWARERGIDCGPDWALAIARAQVSQHKPDVVMINPFFVPSEWLSQLRRDVPSIRLVVARHSSPRADLSRFASCDVVVSGDRRQVAELREAGINGVHLHHGFDARVLRFLPHRKGVKRCVAFTGQLLRRPGFHMYRTDVVRAIADAGIPLDLRLLSDPGFRARVRRTLGRARWKVVQGFRRLGVSEAAISSIPRFRPAVESGPPAGELDRALRKLALPPVFGLEMLKVLRGTVVALNVHGDVSVSEANNLRLWEATGVGTCLLTDAKDNLGDLFEVGKEVVAFESAADAVDKARWLLDNPLIAEAIARAGQERTLKDHTYERRAVELDQIIQQAL